MYRLYDYPSSGNSYKVRLLLALLDHPYERVDVDIMAGESRTPEFLSRNPNGRIPALEVDDGQYLWESNAILHFLAEGTALLPSGRLAHARVLQWMFFEQYSHEPFIAVVRFWRMHDKLGEHSAAELDGRMKGGYAALGVMERHLAGADWFVGQAMSIADVALYAYTHVAHEGGFDLGEFPQLRAWIARVAAQPGHIAITDLAD